MCSMNAPSFYYEKKLWKNGLSFIAGLDEVGRGCFAGSVVAGSVVFEPGKKIPDEITINDSKKLSAKVREQLDKWIKENALTWGVGEASVAMINRSGMTKATNYAFRKAIKRATGRIDDRIEYLLIDAFYIPYTRNFPVVRKNDKLLENIFDGNSRQMAIKKGDSKSTSIAAASIIAKVYRDKRMKRLAKKKDFKVYKWEKNKGYGTKEHREAIVKFGTTKHHRQQFVNTLLSKL